MTLLTFTLRCLIALFFLPLYVALYAAVGLSEWGRDMKRWIVEEA